MSRKNTFITYGLIAFLFPFIGWGGNTEVENASEDLSNLSLNPEDKYRKMLLSQIDPEILEICPEINYLSLDALICVKLVGSEVVKNILNEPKLVTYFKKTGGNSQSTFDEKLFVAIIYYKYKCVYNSKPKSLNIYDYINNSTKNIDYILDRIVREIISSSSNNLTK